MALQKVMIEKTDKCHNIIKCKDAAVAPPPLMGLRRTVKPQRRREFELSSYMGGKPKIGGCDFDGIVA